MKKQIAILSSIILSLIIISCSKFDMDYDTYDTNILNIKLTYPQGYEAKDSVSVILTDMITYSTYSYYTDSSGYVSFHVPSGVYSVTGSEVRSISGNKYIFNGTSTVYSKADSSQTDTTLLELSVSMTSQIIIKELYNGGCQKDSSGTFTHDSYIILYNNSDTIASLDKICLGVAMPYNATTNNADYSNGELFFKDKGWLPAAQGIWYFPDGITLASGEQIVVALENAVDNTVTYSNSINFAHEEYYCAYDIEEFDHELYYPSPSAAIPTSHYLSGVNYGPASAWVLSNRSPAVFIFATDSITPSEFGHDASYNNYYNGSSVSIRKKVPVKWVLDGIEVFAQGIAALKRLTDAVDAGSVRLIRGYGYTLYRNVDKEATEALEKNKDKLVYGYAGGTTDLADGTTDESGIDAEASIANGARIIYKDTNNSSNDFHQRKVASLKE